MCQNHWQNGMIFARIRCIFAFAIAPQTQGRDAVGMGHLVGHHEIFDTRVNSLTCSEEYLMPLWNI